MEKSQIYCLQDGSHYVAVEFAARLLRAGVVGADTVRAIRPDITSDAVRAAAAPDPRAAFNAAVGRLKREVHRARLWGDERVTVAAGDVRDALVGYMRADIRERLTAALTGEFVEFERDELGSMLSAIEEPGFTMEGCDATDQGTSGTQAKTAAPNLARAG